MFLTMHAVIRGTSGISLPQNLNASDVHAHRCSGVPSACDFPVDATVTSTPIVTAARQINFVIAISPALDRKLPDFDEH